MRSCQCNQDGGHFIKSWQMFMWVNPTHFLNGLLWFEDGICKWQYSYQATTPPTQQG